MSEKSRVVDYFNRHCGHLRAEFKRDSVKITMPYQSAQPWRMLDELLPLSVPRPLRPVVWAAVSAVIGLLVGLRWGFRPGTLTGASLCLLLALLFYFANVLRSRLIVEGGIYGLTVHEESRYGHRQLHRWLRHEVVDVYPGQKSKSRRLHKEAWIRVRLEKDDTSKPVLDAHSHQAAQWIVEALREAMQIR